MNLPSWMRNPGFQRSAAPPIGVDFAPDAVHWVQLKRFDAPLALRDAASIRHGGDIAALLASPSDLKNHVRDVFARGRFKGRRIVTQAPSEFLRLMVLNYTMRPDLSEPEQIIELTQERMRDDLDHHVVDFVPIRTSGDRQGDRSALVAVIPEEPVIAHLDRLQDAGLDVAALEIEPVSVRRLISNLVSQTTPDSEDGALNLVLRFHRQRTALTLLSGRRLLLYREIEYGSDDLASAVSKGLECEEDGAMDLISSFGVGGAVPAPRKGSGTPTGASPASEPSDELEQESESIRATLRDLLRPSLRTVVEQTHKAISYAAFQTRGSSLDQVMLMEGVLPCPGLEGLLSDMLQLPVETFRPLSTLAGDQAARQLPSDARLATAFGFSMRGIDRG
ncbi:MAG: hypothetical protein AB8G23_12275 [Myxococcota bacterium]